MVDAMKKLKLCLDTSILGAIYDTDDQERLNVTNKLLKLIKNKKYDGYITEIALIEVDRAPNDIKLGLSNKIKEVKFNILEETENSLELAGEFIKEGIFSQESRDDGRHIAIAVINDMDVIVSWNFKHMVNIEKKKNINSVNLKCGYKQIEIVSPYEVVDYE